MTNAILVNDFTGTNINFKEYNINWDEPYNLIPGDQILIGYDYNTEIVYLYVNSSVLNLVPIGTMPTSEFDINDPYRLIVTFESSHSNRSIIPYEIQFNFSEEIIIPPYNTNSQAEELINPLIPVLERPIIVSVVFSPEITTDELLHVEYTSIVIEPLAIEQPAIGSVSIDVYDNETWLGGASGLATSGDFLFDTLLPSGTYTICVTAYSEPLINVTVCRDLTVIATGQTINTDSINNINTITDIDIFIDILPLVTSFSVVQIDNTTVDLIYTTSDASSVNILTTFGQSSVGDPINGTVRYIGLSNNDLYTLVIMAVDLEGNIASQNVTFELTRTETVNNTKGVLGKKYFRY